MRKGVNALGVTIGLILLLLVFIGVATLLGKTTSSSEAILRNYQDCEGFVGILTGEKGECLPSITCSDVSPPEGKQWQYVGSWGCTEETHCCILRPDNLNPLKIRDIAAAQCEGAEPGTIAIVAQDGAACITPPEQNQQKVLANLDPNKPITVRYYYGEEKTCTGFVSLDYKINANNKLWVSNVANKHVFTCNNGTEYYETTIQKPYAFIPGSVSIAEGTLTIEVRSGSTTTATFPLQARGRT